MCPTIELANLTSLGKKMIAKNNLTKNLAYVNYTRMLIVIHSHPLSAAIFLRTNIKNSIITRMYNKILLAKAFTWYFFTAKQ